MNTGSLILSMKEKIAEELIRDPAITAAVCTDGTVPENPEDLYGTRIFRYHRLPDEQGAPTAYLTVQVHIPRSEDRNNTFLKPTLELWVITHESLMPIAGHPEVNAGRNDYVSQLLDEKFQGYEGLGYGRLAFAENTEGVLPGSFLYRKLIYETLDFNGSVYDRW